MQVRPNFTRMHINRHVYVNTGAAYNRHTVPIFSIIYSSIIESLDFSFNQCWPCQPIKILAVPLQEWIGRAKVKENWSSHRNKKIVNRTQPILCEKVILSQSKRKLAVPILFIICQICWPYSTHFVRKGHIGPKKEKISRANLVYNLPNLLAVPNHFVLKGQALTTIINFCVSCTIRS